MAEKNSNIGLRKQMKKSRPDFVRQDAHKKQRLGRKWRRPKGIQSKMRLGKKGYRRCVDTGFRSPRMVRGLSRDGLSMVIVRNVNELSGLEKKTHCVVISSAVGKKKKVEVVKKCNELGLRILNVKNADEFIKKVEDEVKKKKEKKAETKKEKEKKRQEREKKAKEKEEKEKKDGEKKPEEADELTEKIKKEEEKKEIDKALIKKDSV